jgi:hypothetical protein
LEETDGEVSLERGSMGYCDHVNRAPKGKRRFNKKKLRMHGWKL